MKERGVVVLILLLSACGSPTAPAASLVPLLWVEGAAYATEGEATRDYVLGEQVGVVEERIHCSDVVVAGEPNPCPDPHPDTRIWSNHLAVGTPIYTVLGLERERALGVVESGTLRLAWTTAMVPVGGELVLAIGEEATVEALTIRFIEVAEDSRCPTGVTCVWQGNARVVLAVLHEGTTSVAELNSSHGPRTAEIGGYTLDMVRLDPYPDQATAGEIPSDAYRLRLRVSRPAPDA